MTDRTDTPRAAASPTGSSPSAAPSSTPNRAPAPYLGAATVIAADAHRPRVRLVGAPPLEVVATTAFTFPYQPEVGDTLLVLGEGAEYHAVGVIAGRRPHALVFPGAATVRAVNGKLTLASDQAVELRAPRVTLRTGLLRTIADRVVEKSGELRRWVRGVFALRAGSSRRLVDGLDSTRCENSTTLAKHTVTIDGDHLNLGH
ncbi:MAG: DUF3540 domain-containing protein [Planctomycetota bacterium]